MLLLFVDTAVGLHHRPPAPQPGPPNPPEPSTPVGPGRGMVLSPDWISAISHAIPLRVFQLLKSDRRYSAVFERVSIRVVGELHAKFVWAGRCCCLWILRPGPVIHWRRGRALRALRRPPYQWGQVVDVRLCASPRILPYPPVPPTSSTQVGPGVLSWLAPSLPCVRYKTLPARLLGGENGTKLSPHA